MFTEAHYGAVLNYFYFMLLDEGLALNAAYKTIKLAQKKSKDVPKDRLDPILIWSMSTVLAKYKKRGNHSVQPPRSDWRTPNREYLAAWKEYIRKISDDSSEALVLRYILGYPIETIAKGLEIPEGTVFFRLERGLESFAQGSFLQTVVRK